MANPQIENGFTRIANVLLEALIKAEMSGHCFRLTLLILRKTYGFNKREDTISLTQMAKISGMSKSRCSQIINILEDIKIVTVSEYCNGLTKKYRFNKDYEVWKTVSENCYHNINITKEIFSPTSNEVRLSELLFFLIRHRYPNFKQPNLQKWASHIDKMLRLDKRPVDEVEKVITWCQADSFWQANILSTQKLREKYDQLYLKAGKLTNQTRYF
ncbi:MAG: replication protein [Candidatus Brocadiaceae bacterium]|nr:replication protein [Candidatus Brocadiaceae bacterium]